MRNQLLIVFLFFGTWWVDFCLLLSSFSLCLRPLTIWLCGSNFEPFVLILVRIYWVSWICKLIFLIHLERFCPLYLYFYTPFTFYFLSKITFTNLLAPLILPHISACVHRLCWPLMYGYLWPFLASAVHAHSLWSIQDMWEAY